MIKYGIRIMLQTEVVCVITLMEGTRQGYSGQSKSFNLLGLMVL